MLQPARNGICSEASGSQPRQLLSDRNPPHDASVQVEGDPDRVHQRPCSSRTDCDRRVVSYPSQHGASTMKATASIVVTTVQAPTECMHVLAERARLHELPWIVVGDRKGPSQFLLPPAEFVSIDQQKHLPFK